jgi:hypothetical protein
MAERNAGQSCEYILTSISDLETAEGRHHWTASATMVNFGGPSSAVKCEHADFHSSDFETISRGQGPISQHHCSSFDIQASTDNSGASHIEFGGSSNYVFGRSSNTIGS